MFFLPFTLSPARFHPPFGRSLSLCLQGVGSRHQTNFFQKIRSPVTSFSRKRCHGRWRFFEKRRLLKEQYDLPRCFLPVPGAWRFFREKRHNFVLSADTKQPLHNRERTPEGRTNTERGQLAGTVRRTTSKNAYRSPPRGGLIFPAQGIGARYHVSRIARSAV